MYPIKKDNLEKNKFFFLRENLMLSNKEAIKNTVKNHEPGIFNKSISWVK